MSDAETEAARKAIADAGIEPADVGAVLVQSFLPDEVQPKNAGLIAHNLGIRNAPAWEVDSICNSTLTHVTVGSSLILSGLARHVLCVQSVAYSRVRDPGSSSSLQEADMASAFVLGPSSGARIAASWRTDGRLHGAIKLQWTPPTGAPARQWWEQSQERLLIRFDAGLQEQVMGEIAGRPARLRRGDGAGRDALRRARRLRGAPAHVLEHRLPLGRPRPGGADGIAFDTFDEYANVNSASITASLHEARRTGRIPPRHQGAPLRPVRRIHLRRAGDRVVSGMKVDHITAIVADADVAARALGSLLGTEPVGTVDLPGMTIRFLPGRGEREST